LNNKEQLVSIRSQQNLVWTLYFRP